MIVLYYCWSVLFLWRFCVTSDESKYLQVKEVEICPTNQTSWEKASHDLNCNPPDRYQCTSNENQTALLEYCYDQPPTFVEKGYCWILSNSYSTNTYSCSGFTKGCPNTTYRSDKLYKYQECLLLNKTKGCYLADRKCIREWKGITTQFTTYGSKDDTLASKIIISVILFCIFIFVFIFITATFAARRNTGKKRNDDEEEERKSFISECPKITFREVKFDEDDIIIEYEVSLSEECKSPTTLSWRRDGCDLILPDQSGTYKGGTLEDSWLKICCFTEESLGRYECTVRDNFGEFTDKCILECPRIYLGEIKTDGPDVLIMYEVVVSKECKSLTTLSWGRYERDFVFPIQPETYSGGTLDNSHLRISKNSSGKYECRVANIFGVDTKACILGQSMPDLKLTTFLTLREHSTNLTESP